MHAWRPGFYPRNDDLSLTAGCRSMEKCEEAREDLSSRGLSGTCECSYLDLSDFGSVRAFARRTESRLGRDGRWARRPSLRLLFHSRPVVTPIQACAAGQQRRCDGRPAPAVQHGRGGGQAGARACERGEEQFAAPPSVSLHALRVYCASIMPGRRYMLSNPAEAVFSFPRCPGDPPVLATPFPPAAARQAAPPQAPHDDFPTRSRWRRRRCCRTPTPASRCRAPGGRGRVPP